MNENGFIFHENGNLKICRIPKFYSITSIGLLRRNKVKRFIFHNNIQTCRQGNVNNYFIINVEKELRPTLVYLNNQPANNPLNTNSSNTNVLTNNVNNSNQSMIVNKNVFFLTLRTEEYEKINLF